MRKEKREAQEKKGESTIRMSGLMVVLALVFILLGVLTAVLPAVTTFEITSLQFAYALAAILIAFGIFLIVRYFLTESYKNPQQYGFSIGAILVIAGMMALIRASVLSEYFLFALGALMLAAATFKLQNALDLKALSDRSWGVWLVIAGVFAFCAILVIINPFRDPVRHEVFAEWTVLIDGIVSLIGTIYLYFRLKKATAADRKKDETVDTAEFTDAVPQEHEVAPEGEPEQVIIDPDANEPWAIDEAGEDD